MPAPIDTLAARRVPGVRKPDLAPACACPICAYRTACPRPQDLAQARGNTQRFLNETFQLWKCPRCQTLRTLGTVNYPELYRDYPLNKRRLDVFARGTLRNLLGRLKQSGLRTSDAILDFGCGNGVFLQYLKEQGYPQTAGYDPYCPEFSHPPPEHARFDCVIANDVIEHVDDPRRFVLELAARLQPGGLLYIGTSDAEGVEMGNLHPHLMRLHLPFHRTIFTHASLLSLADGLPLKLLRTWKRSYMDTRRPFSNYRFLDEFNRALGHNMDLALDPASARVVAVKPWLLFYAFLGSFFPSAYEPAAVFRAPHPRSAGSLPACRQAGSTMSSPSNGRAPFG